MRRIIFKVLTFSNTGLVIVNFNIFSSIYLISAL